MFIRAPEYLLYLSMCLHTQECKKKHDSHLLWLTFADAENDVDISGRRLRNLSDE